MSKSMVQKHKVERKYTQLIETGFPTTYVHQVIMLQIQELQEQMSILNEILLDIEERPEIRSME